MKNFIIISAPSGSEKQAYVKILIQDKSIEFSVLHYKNQRNQEKNGIDYIFLTQEEFIKK